MKGNYTAETSVTIEAPAEKVWKAITTPELIAKYLYGTKVTSDWEEGSAIGYEGEYNGKGYEDKGTIKTLIPNEVFAATYWSSMGGKEDKPENYNLVTYTLTEGGDRTVVTLTQDNIATDDEKQHATANWNGVLAELKKVAEGL
ncbi:ATPase [Flavobacterium album]|uniref:ATPase n=1 Tax=Flavobacterium album TaxID=2175091 RepID=A0A2S1QYX0_9FLAO|nr:SRPBCC family protein [Flavobacterium album]AWH85617.1 ATPase [Flavobacterium album]